MGASIGEYLSLSSGYVSGVVIGFIIWQAFKAEPTEDE